MTNKEYKPLTTGGFANPKMLQEYRDRLCYLEDCIEKGTLVFLPCNIGDKFWWIKHSYVGNKPIGEGIVTAFSFCDGEMMVYDMHKLPWKLTEIYFTKEAAEKALEELKK